jgi:hypothetical protein
MSKIVASIAVVLLVGSSAFGLGLIDQGQETTIGLLNTITLLHGHQQASGSQNLAIQNLQDVCRPCPTWAAEGLIGAIGQVASACGECGLIEVAQGLTGGALQAQEVGDCVEPKAQLQTVALLADQTVGRTAGPGGGNALHTIVLRGQQDAGNAAGTMSESSSIMGIQTSSVNGEAMATGVVDTSMAVTTTQTQASI